MFYVKESKKKLQIQDCSYNFFFLNCKEKLEFGALFLYFVLIINTLDGSTKYIFIFSDLKSYLIENMRI